MPLGRYINLNPAGKDYARIDLTQSSESPVSVPPHGRFAPSPTGLLHVGGARTALVAWLSTRSVGGRFTLRIEDLDVHRAVPGIARQITDDLAWLGIDFDSSPDLGGPHVPYVQSAADSLYEQALNKLHRAGCLFPCRISRKDLQNLATAPHGPERGPPYPAHLRPKMLGPEWLHNTKDAAVRFLVPDKDISFLDRLFGLQTENVSKTVGDFVLRRRDDLFAYQLAVVVDDLRMGITEVVRGEDLLSSTARQIMLIEALGGTLPAYGHVPLVLNEDGEKLSKRDEGLTVHSLRSAGVSPESLVGYFAFSLGLVAAPGPQKPGDLARSFAWHRIAGTDPWRMPRDLVATLGYQDGVACG